MEEDSQSLKLSSIDFQDFLLAVLLEQVALPSRTGLIDSRGVKRSLI
jgi:hypothetical protein